MKNANATDEAFARWIRALPMRWALGGFSLGLVWSLISALLQGGFSNPVGGHVAGFVRAFALIVLPLSVLGLAWGWSERIGLGRRLERSGTQSFQAINGWVLRQIGKAMVCGALFGAFTYGIGLFRAFQLWDSMEAVTANLNGVLGFALLAAPVGAVIGAFSRRNLRRYLSGADLHKVRT